MVRATALGNFVFSGGVLSYVLEAVDKKLAAATARLCIQFGSLAAVCALSTVSHFWSCAGTLRDATKIHTGVIQIWQTSLCW